ncbi:MAG: four helix bundle protein [Candidatus Woesearchaeota archaeon]
MSRNHLNLLVYQKAYSFVLECYAVCDSLLDAAFSSQLRRALLSVPLNIAEGCGSRSQKVFRNHLSYAYASSQEVDVLLSLSCDLAFLDDSVVVSLREDLDVVKKMLFGLLVRVEKEISGGRRYSSYRSSSS